MFQFDAEKSVHFCDGLRRRDFLHAGSLALLGFALPCLESGCLPVRSGEKSALALESRGDFALSSPCSR